MLPERGVFGMSQPPLDSVGTAYRRKVWTKLIVFVVLVAVIWLHPKIQAWLEGHNAGGPDASAEVEQSDSEPSIASQHSAERKRVVINDVDEPVVVEVDRSGPTSGAKSKAGKDSTTSTSKPTATSALGQLKEIRKNVFESTAGLRYVPGSADNHRLRHVMQHAKDDTSKPIHGVFEGNRDQILAVIDEAYLKAKKGGREVHSEEQNDRLAYTVNLGRKIGYMGGSEGKRTGNPECRYVRIVLEDGNVVISAYPMKSF